MDDPDYWYSRAEEVLARSEATASPMVREILVRIYADYLRLGRLAEERAKYKVSDWNSASPPLISSVFKDSAGET